MRVAEAQAYLVQMEEKERKKRVFSNEQNRNLSPLGEQWLLSRKDIRVSVSP